MKDFLLVDDVLNFINKSTRKRIYIVNDVKTALNGKLALNLVSNYYNKKLPDVTLLDINMPIINGFGFLERFNQISIDGKENVKIVVITSPQSPNDIFKAKDLGANACISKPFSKRRCSQLYNIEKHINWSIVGNLKSQNVLDSEIN